MPPQGARGFPTDLYIRAKAKIMSTETKNALKAAATSDMQAYSDAEAAKRRALVRNDVGEYFAMAAIATVHMEQCKANWEDHRVEPDDD